MKKILRKILLIIIIAFFFSCNPNVIIFYNNKKTDEKMEKLDLNKLKNEKNSEKKGQKIKVWNDPENNTFSEYNLYDKKNNINTKIFKTNFDGYQKSVCYYDYYLGMPCIIGNLSYFDINGNLVRRGKCYGGIILEEDFNNKSIENAFLREERSLKIGIWKEYNIDGDLIREIDYEEGFDFNLKNVLDYINSVPNLSPNGSVGSKIDRNHNDKEWIISYSVSEEKKFEMNARLDGKTGKVISERKLTPRQF